MIDTAKETWNDDDKREFEVWKYYAGIGGADKDRMIQIVSWLLGFSAAIIGVYATNKLAEPQARVLLIVVGILVSFLAAFTALLYGGYATWNWSIADRIAEANHWTDQTPDYDPIKRPAPLTARVFLRLAKPCQNRIAPVFWLYFGVSLLSLGVQIILLFHAGLSINK